MVDEVHGVLRILCKALMNLTWKIVAIRRSASQVLLHRIPRASRCFQAPTWRQKMSSVEAIKAYIGLVIYPLVMTNIAMEAMAHRNRWFTY